MRSGFSTNKIPRMPLAKIIAQSGTAYFTGTSGQTIPLLFRVEGLDATDYEVLLNPIEDPDGALGEIWLTKLSDRFIVYNSGSGRTEFSYRVNPNATGTEAERPTMSALVAELLFS